MVDICLIWLRFSSNTVAGRAADRWLNSILRRRHVHFISQLSMLTYTCIES